MHKIILLLLFVPVIGYSQDSTAHIIKDTLFIKGEKFIKGESILLGMGSNAETKGFNFIYTSPWSMSVTKLGSGWAHTEMKIKDIKKASSKKFGTKYYLTLVGGYWCEIEPAIETKEVIQ
jgi:hypothetical protein